MNDGCEVCWAGGAPAGFEAVGGGPVGGLRAGTADDDEAGRLCCVAGEDYEL